MSLVDSLYWSEEETLQAIKGLLPPGWRFVYRLESAWVGFISDENDVPQWTKEAFAPNTLVLDAYKWLYTRGNPTPTSLRWNPHRNGLTREIARENWHPMPAVAIPDPEDLDPTEIESVYGLQTKTDSSRR